jgi:lipopolysaccharide/colanic/teichoic acid biosynthesis glycosyltransferase
LEDKKRSARIEQPVLLWEEREEEMYRKFIKRLFDLLLSLAGIIVLLPVLLVLWVLVRVKLGSPALFTQERPGKNEKVFKLYKFRSMTDERDKNGELLPDEIRLTRFGRLLRATSLDELPELFNILKGDMSLIGPRPLLVRYLPYYTKEERHRHDVRPGLTGLAQVNGRNALGWEDRFAYDLEYVNHLTFGMDIKIIAMTVGKVLKRSGTLSGADQTVADFDVYRKGQEK